MLKVFLIAICALSLFSCRRTLVHQRIISNGSTDTVIVKNPDEKDTAYIIAPLHSAMIYDFEVLDTKQECEPCMWIGPTLSIKKTNGLDCQKQVKNEDNWTKKIEGTKDRKETCTFLVVDTDFH